MLRSSLGIALLVLSACENESATPAPATPTNKVAAPVGCTAANTVFELKHHDTPAGWKVVGTIEILVSGRPEPGAVQFDGYVIKDATGKAVAEKQLPAQMKSEEEFRKALADGMCSIGGAAAVAPADRKSEAELDNELKTTGKTRLALAVLASPPENEAADLDLLCTKPKDIDEQPDDPRARQLGYLFDGFDRYRFLSSRKWRDFMGQIRAAEGQDAVHARSRDLQNAARAAGKTTCWFAQVLEAL